MYNGHEYLSCIKIPAAKQAMTTSAHKPDGKAEPMDFTADRRDLISVANKVFGEGKWNHTVVSQTLDFVDTIDTRDKCRAGCASFVKVQLDNGNFHEDVGYHIAEESTKGLSIQNARIGSAVNALKRVLLSFGDNIERKLQQLRRQISPEQTNDVQKDVAQSLDKQISKKSNMICVPVNKSDTALRTECLRESKFLSSLTSFIKRSISNEFSLTEHTNEPEANKNSITGTWSTPWVTIDESADSCVYPLPNKTNTTEHKPKSDPTLVPTVNNGKTEADPSSSVIIQNVKREPSLNKTSYTSEQKSKPDPTPVSTVNNGTTEADPSSSLIIQNVKKEPSLNKTSSTSEQKSKPALSKNEMLRLERKRKQMEKQMEFKKRMMEKGELMSTSDSKPNPRY